MISNSISAADTGTDMAIAAHATAILAIFLILDM